MKGLNKIALVAAIAAASTAQAELVAMDDASMSATTGQAGLTIDVNAAEISIGEIAYQDGGFVGINGLTLAGAVDPATGTAVAGLTDIRMTVDVVGSDGAAGVAYDLGSTYLAGAPAQPGEVDQNALISDGDLIISLRSQSGNPIAFGLAIDSINIAESTATVGSIGATGTTLVSNLALNGILGPIDIVIDNGTGGMNISAFFAAGGSLELPFVATSVAGFQIGNMRGAGLGPFGHVQMNISQETGYAANGFTGTTALAFDLQNFAADMDLVGIELGDNGQSIGNLYITDMQISAETVVYGH